MGRLLYQNKRTQYLTERRKLDPRSDQRAGSAFGSADQGFTLIELIVVLSIMAMIIGLVILDFGSRRPERDLKIAQNELVTNIRKVQSYSLFSRNVGNLKPAQYYVIKFSAGTPDRYFIQAITDSSSSPTLNDLETIMLPKNIAFSPNSPFVITRPAPIIPSPVASTCPLLAFKAPFGKIYVNDGCNVSVPGFLNGDSYKSILDHLNNMNNLSVSTDTDLLLSLTVKNGSDSKKVLVRGVTGLVCPTVNGTTCSF